MYAHLFFSISFVVVLVVPVCLPLHYYLSVTSDVYMVCV